MADANLGATRAQGQHTARLLGVGPGHHSAAVQQDPGNARHAGAADADHVHPLQLGPVADAGSSWSPGAACPDRDVQCDLRDLLRRVAMAHQRRCGGHRGEPRPVGEQSRYGVGDVVRREVADRPRSARRPR